MQDTYYATTAFDRTRPQALTTRYRLNEAGFHKRQMLRNPLRVGRGIHCGEFISDSSQDYILEQVVKNTEKARTYLKSRGHEELVWSGLQNPKVFLYLFTQSMLFFAVISWIFWGGSLFFFLCLDWNG